MAKIVAGDYLTLKDAIDQADVMVAEGYPRESISLIASRRAARDMTDAADYTGWTVESIEDETDETLWARIKGFFGAENEKIQDTHIAAYRDSLRNGNVLVLVDEYAEPAYPTAEEDQTIRHAEAAADTRAYEADAYAATDRTWDATMDTERDDTLRLREERMNVNKKDVQAGEVVISKHVIEEMETIEVPVRREEVVIERHAVHDEYATDDDLQDETITIPVMEEQVEVTKRPVVTEEIKIHKRDFEEQEQVSATLRKEKLDVQQVGTEAILEEETITR